MIKGRGCADGRKQRTYLNKDDISAPTVATEALLLTCLIHAMEGRYVATVEIHGVFMQAEMEGDDVHMKLEGKMVNILTKINPSSYTKYSSTENGKLSCTLSLKNLYTVLSRLPYYSGKILPAPSLVGDLK